MKELYEALYPLVKDPLAKEALIEPYAKLMFGEFYKGSGIYRGWQGHKDEWMSKAREKLESGEKHG